MSIENGTRAYVIVPWERVVLIAMIYVLIGPFVGGVVMFAVNASQILYQHGSLGFPRSFGMLIFFSYWVGTLLALLTGLIVGAFRVSLGRTTIVTPLIAAVLAWGASLLLYVVLPMAPLISLPFLPHALISSVACWFVAKKVKLA
jgi:hypothetical protein